MGEKIIVIVTSFVVVIVIVIVISLVIGRILKQEKANSKKGHNYDNDANKIKKNNNKYKTVVNIFVFKLYAIKKKKESKKIKGIFSFFF